MDTENKKVDDDWDWYFNPDPEEEARMEAMMAEYRPKRAALLDKVRAGEMTEDECADAIIRLRRDLGHKSLYTREREKSAVLHVMAHSLHQDEFDRIQREDGTIID